MSIDNLRSLNIALPSNEGAAGETSFFVQVFQENPQPMWIFDRETLRFLEVNRAAQSKYGYSLEEFKAMTLYDIRPPETHARFIECLRKRFRGEPAEKRGIHLTKGGERLVTEILSNPITFQGRLAQFAVIKDVTSEAKAEDWLRQSKAILESTIDATSTGMLVVRNDGHPVLANERFAELWKVPEHLPGNVSMRSHCAERTSHPDAFATLLDDLDANPRNYDGQILLADGTLLEVHVKPYLLDGEIAGRVWSFLDVTLKHEPALRLEAQERELRSILENTQDVICSFDKNYRLLGFNTRYIELCRLHGGVPERGKSILEVFPEGDTILGWQPLFERGLNGERFSIERKISYNGGFYWAEISVNPIFVPDSNGLPIIDGVVVFGKNINSRKLAEEALRSSEANLMGLIENTTDMIYSVDRDYRLLTFNSAFREAYVELRATTPFIGMSILTTMPEEIRAFTLVDYERAFNNERLHFERAYEYPRGTRWYDVNFNPICDGEGNVTSVAIFNRDVTARYQMQLDLIAAKERAEQTNRLKSSFLANMSHEIRTPVTSILGFSSLIAEETNEPELKSFAESIERSGKRLLETINSILDLAKVEADRFDYRSSCVCLDTEITEALRLIGPLARAKNLSVSATAHTKELYVDVDPQYLGQVLINLLGNAVKFTDKGSIEIAVTTDDTQVNIAVKDTGVGISKQFLPRVFEEFEQESAGYERKFEGSGLGLTISKKLVERMGGSLTAESTLGEGSTFTVTLPKVNPVGHLESMPSSITTQTSESLPTLATPRILLVEDTFETSEMIKLFLRTIAPIDHAKDADTAFTFAENDKGYDVILMDINLGRGPSGIDVTKKLRENALYASTPIIALTAYAMKGDREQILAAGCTDYLSKPFSKKDLLAMLDKYMRIES